MSRKEYNDVVSFLDNLLSPARINRYSSAPTMADRIHNEIEKMRREIFRTDNTTTSTDDTTVIHVGEGVTPDDISVELSSDKRKLHIEVNKVDEENGIKRYLSQTYVSSRQFNNNDMSVELADGDLIIYAPYVDDSSARQEIQVKHTPEITEGSEEESPEEEASERPEDSNDTKQGVENK